jgi:hypothetical protein
MMLPDPEPFEAPAVARDGFISDHSVERAWTCASAGRNWHMHEVKVQYINPLTTERWELSHLLRV